MSYCVDFGVHSATNCCALFGVCGQEAKLRQLFMSDDIVKYNFSNFDPFPCPLDPTLVVRGIQPDNATLFKVTLLNSFSWFKSVA